MQAGAGVGLGSGEKQMAQSLLVVEDVTRQWLELASVDPFSKVVE